MNDTLNRFTEIHREITGEDFAWNKKNSQALGVLFENSPRLTQFIFKQPSYAGIISELAFQKEKKVFQMADEAFGAEFDSAEQALNKHNQLISLRLYKYTLLCSLAARYLLRKIEPLEFCSAWNDVAEKCCMQAFRFAYRNLVHEIGEPVVINDADAEEPFKFSIIALGKLGAGELNLSSDIDLLFIYNSGKGFLRENDQKTIGEFAEKLASGITNILSKNDEIGFCFRVDNDLRPEGKQGPLANSIDAALGYYEYCGTEMERMMLIRANPIAGDTELGNEFIESIKPFIYRRSWDLAALKKIKETKAAIEQEALKSTKDGIDVKRGEGGIREIEFIVQSIQLLNGGKNENIISRNTLDSIDIIKKTHLLPSKECDRLSTAYKFLRHIENMIQLPDEKQTHILTTDPQERQKLAKRMGYEDTQSSLAMQKMMTEFGEHTDIVKHHFQHMFETDFEKHQMSDAILTNISTCLSDEEEVDSLPWFRHEEIKRIRYKDLQENMSPFEVSEKLSIVAEVVISEAYKIASKSLRNIYGPPLSEQKGRPIAGLAIVGMGKLGGREIDYASDLDVMFIYSDGGHTAGPQVITNQEYFTKLSQRIISLITLPTRYGRAYQIDTDLRPSGRAGILVTPLQTFKNYHNIEAQIWERQALLKARPVAGDPKFCETVSKTLDELRYGSHLPPDFKEKIGELRLRMEKERSKETDKRFNVKTGYGGLMDIETVIQYLQLKNGSQDPTIRSNNSLDSLKNLIARQIIDDETGKNAIEFYLFLRRLLSRIRLFSNHATDFIDTDSQLLEQIAKSLGFENKDELVQKYLKNRKDIRKIYNKYFGSYSA